MRPRRTAAAAIAVVTLLCSVMVAPPALAMPMIEVVRGDTPVDSVIAVSVDAFPGAGTVVITDGRPDGYTAGVLARDLGAPVLLADFGDNAALLAEVDRLGATEARILGSEVAVSAQLQEDLETEGLTVTRYAGANRFETAVLVSEDRNDPGTEVVVVDGQDPLLAHLAASEAARQGAALLLVSTFDVPAVTRSEIDRLDPATVTYVADDDSFSQAVRDELATLTTVDDLRGTTVREVGATIARRVGITSGELALVPSGPSSNAVGALVQAAVAAYPGGLTYADDDDVSRALVDDEGPATIRLVDTAELQDVGPEIGTPTTTPVAPVEGEQVTLTIPFTNDDPRDNHTMDVDLGDGSTDQLTSVAPGSPTLTHTWDREGPTR